MTRQVITTHDWFNAKFDYLIEQLNGRFRMQFPEYLDVLDSIVEDLRDPCIRMFEIDMIQTLNQHVFTVCSALNQCSLSGCQNTDNHEFLREFINLIWDSHNETDSWLKAQGIVSGQCTN